MWRKPDFKSKATVIVGAVTSAEFTFRNQPQVTQITVNSVVA